MAGENPATFYMDNFIIGNNEMGPEKHIYYITHMLNPVAVIAVHQDHVTFKEGVHYQHFEFDGELWTLQIHFLFSTQFDGEQQATEVTTMLKKAWRWYKAYMQWEGQQ